MKDNTLFGCSKVIWIYPLTHSGGKQRFVCRDSLQKSNNPSGGDCLCDREDQSGPSALTPHIQQFATMLLKVWTGFSLDLRNLVLAIVAAIRMLNFWSCSFWPQKVAQKKPWALVIHVHLVVNQTWGSTICTWKNPLKLRFSDQRNGSLRSCRFACPSPGCRRWVPSNWKEFLREPKQWGGVQVCKCGK